MKKNQFPDLNDINPSIRKPSPLSIVKTSRRKHPEEKKKSKRLSFFFFPRASCLQGHGGETDGTDETTHGEGELVTGGARAGRLGSGASGGAGAGSARLAGAALAGIVGTGAGAGAGAAGAGGGSSSLAGGEDVRKSVRVGVIVVELVDARLLAFTLSLVVVGSDGLLRDAFLAHALIQADQLAGMRERVREALGAAVAIIGRAFGEALLSHRQGVGGGRGDGGVGGGGGGGVGSVGDGSEENGGESVLHFEN